MPLYEVTDDGLQPFAKMKPGPDLYEQEIETCSGSTAKERSH